jgi:hypothetical protein
VKKAKATKLELVKINEDVNNAIDSGDLTKIDEIVTKGEADPKYKDDKRFENRIIAIKERAPVAIKVKKLNTDEAKKLAKLLVEDVVDYNSKTGKTKDGKTHLERLNEIEKELKEFQSATSGNKQAAYTADSKVAEIVTKLLNEVKTQKDLLEKEEENRNSPTSSGEPSF